MDDHAWLAARFEEQEAWLRLSRSDTGDIENLTGWLTTVVGRVSLNTLRKRRSRREEPLADSREARVPDPIVGSEERSHPEHEALLADSVGLAMLVVLEALTAAERLSFVLHDMFAVPFDDIAPMLGRSAPAVRQLASRARRRVQGAAPVPDTDVRRQRRAVDAFFAAARDGDFEALVGVLHPEVVLRSDGGSARPDASVVLHGARTVAERAVTFAGLAPFLCPALVNGAAGVVVVRHGRPLAIMGFTVTADRIVAIDTLSDADRLRLIDLTALDV